MATQKKIVEVDYSMQEKIIALYELQKIDSKIDEINKVKGELPIEVQDLEDEMTGMQTRIDHINDEIEELNTLTKQRKREVDQSKVLITNYKEQQNNVRNNREFDAITKEVEYQELEIELAEKRLKEYAVGVKAKKQLLEEAEALIAARAADLVAKKEELACIEAETKPQVAELGVLAEKAQAKIDERLLLAYERIRRNVRNGLAVVTVRRDACGGCFNHIPPQRQADIRQGKKLIVCEYCGRILVVDPDEEQPQE
ncbi:MAG: C4-type zinc ribbon domain-containing protein [Alistipes sp.]